MKQTLAALTPDTSRRAQSIVRNAQQTTLDINQLDKSSGEEAKLPLELARPAPMVLKGKADIGDTRTLAKIEPAMRGVLDLVVPAGYRDERGGATGTVVGRGFVQPGKGRGKQPALSVVVSMRPLTLEARRVFDAQNACTFGELQRAGALRVARLEARDARSVVFERHS